MVDLVRPLLTWRRSCGGCILCSRVVALLGGCGPDRHAASTRSRRAPPSSASSSASCCAPTAGARRLQLRLRSRTWPRAPRLPTLTAYANGEAMFRWTPLASDVGDHTFRFIATVDGVPASERGRRRTSSPATIRSRFRSSRSATAPRSISRARRAPIVPLLVDDTSATEVDTRARQRVDRRRAPSSATGRSRAQLHVLPVEGAGAGGARSIPFTLRRQRRRRRARREALHDRARHPGAAGRRAGAEPDADPIPIPIRRRRRRPATRRADHHAHAARRHHHRRQPAHLRRRSPIRTASTTRPSSGRPTAPLDPTNPDLSPMNARRHAAACRARRRTGSGAPPSRARSSTTRRARPRRSTTSSAPPTTTTRSPAARTTRPSARRAAVYSFVIKRATDAALAPSLVAAWPSRGCIARAAARRSTPGSARRARRGASGADPAVVAHRSRRRQASSTRRARTTRLVLRGTLHADGRRRASRCDADARRHVRRRHARLRRRRRRRRRALPSANGHFDGSALRAVDSRARSAACTVGAAAGRASTSPTRSRRIARVVASRAGADPRQRRRRPRAATAFSSAAARARPTRRRRLLPARRRAGDCAASGVDGARRRCRHAHPPTPWDRTRAQFPFAPAIAGIQPGSFTGTVRAATTVLADGADRSTRGSLPLVATVASREIAARRTDRRPASASTSTSTGGGFVGAAADEVTLLHLVGTLHARRRQPQRAPVDLKLVPHFVSRHARCATCSTRPTRSAS